ncbi:MAG TPA: hypothetical protein VGW33_10155 [Terriglobia bacterium]|nr:hypothetical protein [Terriglobia bacterium]
MLEDVHSTNSSLWKCAAVAATLLAVSGCAVRRTTRVAAPVAPAALQQASASDLVTRIDAQSKAVRTLVATVDLEPTAGSVYSGVIKEYRDVKGFILLQSPDHLRIVGQAPVVRTTLFDMVSDGKEFRLSIPPKGKFIVGKMDVTRPAKNALENLRPQHVLDALVLAPINPARDKYFVDREEDAGQPSYAVYVLQPGNGDELSLKRKIWFEGSSLELSRLDLYDSDGVVVEDVKYSGYRDFQGTRYPARIEISRPIEDYRLGINIEKATLNQPIAPQKFELPKPAAAELVELGAVRHPEGPVGQ